MSFHLAPASQTLVYAILLSLPVLLAYIVIRNRKEKPKPFRFLDLPIELRDLVYKELVSGQEVFYPSRKVKPDPGRLAWLKTIFRGRSSKSKRNLIMFANRQIHHEFLNVLCERSLFALSVDQHNFNIPGLWPINKDTLRIIRNCEIRLDVTPNMLDTADPRTMPREWKLCNRSCQILQNCQQLKQVSLCLFATGNAMWNPILDVLSRFPNV